MRAMLRRLTRAACISVHAPDGSHSYVAIFFILVLPNTNGVRRINYRGTRSCAVPHMRRACLGVRKYL